MSWLDRLSDGLDRRVGHRRLLEAALDEPVPGGASWSYVFGSASLILLLVQLGTGIVLATFYSASATDAWASIAYLEREIPFGRTLRGIHHHAASGMVIVVVLHLLQVAFYGAYKAPREANWLAGLGLLGMVLGFALTGYLLPWDQTGYWATKVATSIAGTLPIVGEWIQRFAQGGNDYGNLTLTRFYALHVIVLPLLTFGLVAVHIALFRKHGVTPRPGITAAELEKVDLFWPKQIAYDAVFSLLVVVAILILAVRSGAPLEAPADPASNFIARPEWYFLFLFQLLKYFEGPLEIVGTVIIPGFAATFLAVLPFLDRSPSRRFSERRPHLIAIGIGLFGIAGLTALALRADRNNPQIHSQKVLAEREAHRALELAAAGVPPEGAAIMASRDPLIRGERVFRRECAGCHALEELEPSERKAPELTGYRSKAWIRQVLRDPDSPRLFGKTPVHGMKSFAHLPAVEIEKLVDFLYALRGPNVEKIEGSAIEPLLDESECTKCHDFEDEYGLEGPALLGYASRAWVASVVSNAGADHLYGDMNEMPVFKERLGATDLEAVITWLLTIEDRGPHDRWPWVDDPGPVPTPRKPEPTETATASTPRK
jgi:ubiquinol-cytochrome c reductase cytochrome b subunit